ncbi:MFS transporter [uncultured Sphingomonas sp.]|uniref:MFS transporter n=1 Tax=uncultured Sphingomonas sp. TaxID=158754 RepID=UPI0035CB9930
MTSAAAIPPKRTLSQRTTLTYGFGAVAYGVKDNGFGTFLLLFYNQVVGLSATKVGLVIAAALILDAFIDPAVGFLSDRTRSRWGRRHPWMYASALPIGLGWLLVWSPPMWSEEALLGWLFVAAVLVRSAVSAYEVPSVALTAELSSDYDERTRVMAYRYLFGWIGGLGALFAGYAIFLTPDPVMAGRAGFWTYGVVTAALIVTAILVSAIGTHREIPTLPQATKSTGTFSDELREMGQSVRNRAFVILMLSALCIYVNQGISYALSTYLYAHVWRFGAGAFAAIPAVLLAGAVIAFLVTPRIGRRFGKPKAACCLVLASVTLLTGPYLLRLAGLFPDPGDPRMLPLYFGSVTVQAACNISAMILGASMMADVVEDAEVKTGRRSEGVFFAGSFFVQKCTSGIGIFIVGVILDAVAFPVGAKPGMVPTPVIDDLTTVFVTIYLTLGVTGALLFTRFPFGRAEHEDRLRTLAVD